MVDDKTDDNGTIDLDTKLVKKIARKFEKTINSILEQEDSDIFLEMLSVLASITVQIALNIGVDKKEFISFMNEVYREGENQFIEEETLNNSSINVFSDSKKTFN